MAIPTPTPMNSERATPSTWLLGRRIRAMDDSGEERRSSPSRARPSPGMRCGSVKFGWSCRSAASKIAVESWPTASNLVVWSAWGCSSRLPEAPGRSASRPIAPKVAVASKAPGPDRPRSAQARTWARGGAGGCGTASRGRGGTAATGSTGPSAIGGAGVPIGGRGGGTVGGRSAGRPDLRPRRALPQPSKAACGWGSGLDAPRSRSRTCGAVGRSAGSLERALARTSRKESGTADRSAWS